MALEHRAIVVFVGVALSSGCGELPTSNEVCADRGGVRSVEKGGWGQKDTVICRDGHAREVWE